MGVLWLCPLAVPCVQLRGGRVVLGVESPAAPGTLVLTVALGLGSWGTAPRILQMPHINTTRRFGAGDFWVSKPRAGWQHPVLLRTARSAKATASLLIMHNGARRP